MKAFYTILSFLAGIMLPGFASSQNEWPKSFTNADGDLVKVYQLQPEAFLNGKLEANAAISVLKEGKGDPVFGMIWLNAGTTTRGQQVDLNTVQVSAIKLPNETDQNVLTSLQNDISGTMTNWHISVPLNDINTALQLSRQETTLSSDLNNNPPKILYASRPSILVVIDGAPKLQNNSKWNVQTVVNTPFIILKENNWFFLYGGRHWYTAPSATGPYSLTTDISPNLSRIQEEVAQANKENNVQQEQKEYEISNIIVTTEPAELLQSDGEPNFTPVQGTDLLYVRNSDNDIFMDVSGQQYYVLLSGRWYRSSSLDGNWQFIDANKLPPDFAKIPVGSPKDNVLASVAGTPAAREAVMDAQVPQTAKIDRKTATADIQYDGDPQFDNIAGTDMDYAVNTSSYVLRWRGSYFAVDNGIWFESHSPAGPWRIATERPYVVSLIPPRYPVYAMKYVYIYDVTPDYIYTGYTSGYLNTFVYGPTVVYGTGYYYHPWYGRYYYPRPYTWGFNMRYNPWTGWGFGFNFNFGWFNFGIGNYSPWPYYGGWWGPVIYRPSYCWTPYRSGYHGGYYGYYGRRNTIVINNNINIYRNNNIYNRRAGVIVTRDNRRVASVYPRNASPVRSERYGNARPVVRDPNRNSGNYDNGRPTVGRSARPANAPRTAAPSAGSNPSSSESTRPVRTPGASSPNRQTLPSEATFPSRRANNESTPPRTRPQPSGQNSNSIQQPVRSSSNVSSSQSRAIERAAPVQRSIQAARQPAQRVERSNAPTRTAGGAERTLRQAGGERRAGRG